MPGISRLEIFKVFFLCNWNSQSRNVGLVQRLLHGFLCSLFCAKTILKGLTLFLGASSLQFLESGKVKAENREMLLVSTGLVQVETLKIQKKANFRNVANSSWAS